VSDIVQKLWGFCHTRRHDGVDYADYIEQLTSLLFLKMADERGAKVPKDCDWESLKPKSGTQLTDHYADILRKLRDAEEGRRWAVDVKGAAFDGLLEKAASEGKKGAGQYFAPRPLIQSIVAVMKPHPRGKPDFRSCDPACGTGGFLVCSYEWRELDHGVHGFHG
jgi:type I restriction enzyme M protein